MTRLPHRSLTLAQFLLPVFFFGCSGEGPGTGAVGSGGVTANGGAIGNGGAFNGGAIGNGGALNDGGASGNGGSVSNGGATSNGGSATGRVFNAGKREMESLDRGVVAINQGGGKVYVGWRMFGLDPGSIAFNVYRSSGTATAVKLNAAPITATTDYVDTGVSLTQSNSYTVKSVIGDVEQTGSAAYTCPQMFPPNSFFRYRCATVA